MEYIVKVFNLTRADRDGVRKSLNLLLLILLFTIAIIGSWQSGGMFLKEIMIGSAIFMFLLFINENEFVKKN